MVFDSAAERLRGALASEAFAALLDGPGQASAAAMDQDVALCSEVILKLQNVARYTCRAWKSL